MNILEDGLPLQCSSVFVDTFILFTQKLGSEQNF